MQSNFLRVLLIVLGCLLVFTAAFPVFMVVRVPEVWETGLIASKLVMLPLGAILLAWAAMMRPNHR